MIGNRASSLPVTQFCGQAGKLGSIGAGRSAAQSSAFHARCAGAANADELCMRLTEEEHCEIQRWHRPADVDLGQGRVLRYADADKELAVAIDCDGSYVEPDSPDAICVGHFDFAWIVEAFGVKLAYVADIKRSEFTNDEGPHSLQLHAYGLAWSTKHNCDGYVCGQWAAEEGLWQWGPIVDLGTIEAVNIMRRVVTAALNTSPEYATGPHCRKCYGRLRCPAWMLPPLPADKAALQPVTVDGELTRERALELLLACQRMEDTAKMLKQNLQAFAERSGGIISADGTKVWKPISMPGKESTSVARVKEAFGADAAKVITKGKSYPQYRWVNV